MNELDYKRYKVLFVDDQLNNLDNLTFSFGLDFDLVTALDGAEALEILDREKLAVVIADQRMPNMTGVELLSRVKESHPEVVRILITAYSDIDAAVDAINMGDIFRYVRKDQPINEIALALRQGIEYYQMKEDLHEATTCLIRSEKLITIAEMSAGIGHEIKNTITGTNLGLDRLAYNLHSKGYDDPDVQKILSKTKEYGKRSAEIVSRLNDFAKPGQVEQVDLHKVVDYSIELAGDGLKELLEHIEIVKNLDPDLPSVEGNYAHFEMILLNLIRNACQAMQETGGTIFIKAKADPEWVRISVQDTGPGIAPENLKRVFGAFYTTRKEGMGMGLYIIDTIVKTFGGRLELESELKQGSTFTVILPIKAPKAPVYEEVFHDKTPCSG